MPPPVKSRFADVSGIRPFNFAREISAHLDQFVGRRWLKAKVKHWLAHESHPVFVLIGAPGIGKSAIACWLSQEMEGQVISLHLCSSRTMRTLDPYEYVAALVRQLVEMLPGFEAALGDVDVARRRPTAKQAFEELVIAPLKAMTAPAAPRLLIVDSLDEALIQNGETILDVIVACAPELPVWLRLLATTRPEEPVLERIRGLNSFELQADQRENQQDVANFLADAVNQEDLRHCLGAEVAAIAQRLAGLANGNFLYARMTVNALQRGELKVADLQRLSGGLEDFFSAAFARHFTEPLDFEQRIRPLLELLSAAFGPLSLAILEVALGVDALELRRRLSPLRLYLRQISSEDDTQIAFAHKLLRDWLTVPSLSGAFQIDPACGHRRLGTTLLDRWSADAYALHHLPSHLIAAERWDDLIGDDTSPGPLTDLRYIQAKCEAGLVYELVGDFNACFAALPDFCEENERNGRYDVATLLHNTALREYAVVRCDWWFAKKRGETLPEPSYPLLLGASRYPGIKKIPDELSPRAARLVHFSCFVFNHFVSMSSEARRAASVSSDHTIRIWDLETGECLRTLAGHVALVSSVSISPDGRRAASVSSDSTVRFWDLETGMCLHVLSGHAASVTSVSVSPDGRRAVSASWDGTLRVWELDTGLCLRSLNGHTGSVTSVHVGPDGRRMVTGSDDKTVRVWDLETGECLLKLIGHEHGVDSVSVTPDGRRAVSVSFCDNTLRVWDLESGEWLYTYKSATAT